MKLRTFDVEGFRCLESVPDIPLGNPTLLTGQNDGGKSSIIKAVEYLLGHRSLEEDDVTYVPSGHTADATRASTSTVTGRFTLSEAEGVYLASLGGPPIVDTVVLRRRTPFGEATVLEYEASVPELSELQDFDSLNVGPLRDLMTSHGLDTKGNKPELLASLRAFAATQPQTTKFVTAPKSLEKLMPKVLSLAGTSDDPDDTVKRALISSLSNHLATSTLQGSITDLEIAAGQHVAEDAEELRAWIQSRANLNSVTISPEVRFGKPALTTRILIEQMPGQMVPLSHAGSGRSRRIMLAVWEWTSKLVDDSRPPMDATHADEDESSEPVAPPLDHVIAYDEPDTHLDYSHQRAFMEIVNEQVAKPNVQMIIATHSLNLIDRLDINDVVNVRLDGNQRTFLETLRTNEHDDIDGHLQAISAALGLRTSVLLHERCFVGLEGETEQQVLPMLFRIHTGLPMQSLGIVPLACGNNDGALRFAQFLTKHGRKVVFLVDEDSRTKSKNLFSEDKLRSFDIDPSTQARYLGQPNEIEDLFTNAQWADLANKVWHKTDGGVWDEAEIETHRKSAKFSASLQESFQNGSLSGPGGKPEMLKTLAMHVTDVSQIPQPIRDAFDWLVESANSQDRDEP